MSEEEAEMNPIDRKEAHRMLIDDDAMKEIAKDIGFYLALGGNAKKENAEVLIKALRKKYEKFMSRALEGFTRKERGKLKTFIHNTLESVSWQVNCVAQEEAKKNEVESLVSGMEIDLKVTVLLRNKGKLTDKRLQTFRWSEHD